MAFDGDPFLIQINERRLKLVGARLQAGASGTLGFETFAGQPPDVSLGALPHWQGYKNALGLDVFLSQAITISIVMRSPVVPISVFMGGTTHADFQAALRNDGAEASGRLEITIDFG